MEASCREGWATESRSRSLRTMHLSDECGRALKGHLSVAPWVVLTIHAWGVTDNVLTIHGNGPTHTDHASHPIPASRHCGVSVTYLKKTFLCF